MFDIGFSEFIVIIIVSILVLGPDKLPEAIKNIALFIKKLQDIWQEATENISKEIEETPKYKDEISKKDLKWNLQHH